MTSRQQALDQIALLIDEHDLTLDEIGARLVVANSAPDKDGKWLIRVLGYLGAILIFSGLALLIAIEWSKLNSAARVVFTYGPGLASFIMGVIVMNDARYKNAATPLFLQSALLLPAGMFVFLSEYAHGNDGQLAAMLIFGLCAVQFMATFYVYHRTTLLFFGYLFWNTALGILMQRSHMSNDLLGFVLGLSILSGAWAMDRTKHRSIAAFWYFIGGIGLLWSLFDTIEHTKYDVAYLGVACAMMLLSVRVGSRTLLMISTFALIGFLGYYTDRHFANVIGWPLALIIMGFLLVGISGYAIRLGGKIKSARA